MQHGQGLFFNASGCRIFRGLEAKEEEKPMVSNIYPTKQPNIQTLSIGESNAQPKNPHAAIRA